MARKRKLVYNDDGTLKDPTVCEECWTKVARSGDMRRHMRKHLSAAEKLSKSYACPFDGCNFKNLQKSNVDTHIRTHTKEKKKCPSCNFETPDPGTLTRHRKRRHEYVPEPRKSRNPGNRSSSDLTQPQIIIETPSTYSRSTSTSTDIPTSPSTSGEYASVITSPFSPVQPLPDSSVWCESDNPQSLSSFAGGQTDLNPSSAGYNQWDAMDATYPTLPTTPTLSLPPPAIPRIEDESSQPSFLRRRPLGIQDILTEEGRVYWGRCS
ncbi:hypothetical protein C8R41DRAFT_629263 [Lentinula lateritia]|uniref:C2H2-type domain-containing protein n=1 Tax=Lentinula lateritia TaxID=40482 RepID=A0ABQ8V186_9AGAR|nr:hypothetical protein C8R41DRAFT_629263 [Lentinula lateritia]